MMTKGMELKEADLKTVCGGDNGDAAKDKDPLCSRYQVGQLVEVYRTNVHASTKCCKIIAAELSYHGYWCYTCQRIDGSAWFSHTCNCSDPTCARVSADEIQS